VKVGALDQIPKSFLREKKVVVPTFTFSYNI
jgi:hypothetical protein